MGQPPFKDEPRMRRALRDGQPLQLRHAFPEQFAKQVQEDGKLKLFEGSDKFRVSPLIVNYNDTIIIIACTKDGHIYGIDANGQLLFDINTGFEINSSPSINIAKWSAGIAPVYIL